MASAALQLAVWLGLAWLLNGKPPSEPAPPLTDTQITWMVAPQLPPRVPIARPPRRSLARTIRLWPPAPRRARRLRARAALPRLPVRPHRLSLDPPSALNAPPVVALGLLAPRRPLPPAARSVASLRLGSFAPADPPAVPRAADPPTPRTGLFATASPGAPLPPALAAGPRLGTFASRPPAASKSPPAPLAATGFGFMPVSLAAGAPPRTTPPPPAPYRPPVILSKPTPRYTNLARARRLEGDVVLCVLLPAAGGVRVLAIVHGLGDGLDQSAVAAVRGIRFLPARRGAHPVDATVLLRVSFRLAQ